MKLALIAAVARNGTIGMGNRLPWRLPADLQHFKTVTMGKPVVMGRKTWESIGRPLPGRLNIVLTRRADFHVEGATVVHSLTEAIQVAGDAPEVMVIGGAELYAEAIGRADTLYLTRVETDVDGDAFFPTVQTSAWNCVASERREADEKNRYTCIFKIYERK